ncbi:hypothetical protein Tco_1133342 [Tanacetum coccineum]
MSLVLAIWKHDRYQYEATVDLKEARKVWVTRSMERCRGTWAIVRKKCESKSQSNNPANWKNFRPEFVNIEADWDGILDSWMKEEWQRRSRAGAENKKKVHGDLVLDYGSCDAGHVRAPTPLA